MRFLLIKTLLLSFITLGLVSCGGSDSGGDVPTPPDDFTFNQWSFSQTNQVVSLSVGTNRDDSKVSFAWDFGDGYKTTEQNPTHSYSAKGEYTIKVIATYEGETIEDTETARITHLGFTKAEIDAFKQSVDNAFAAENNTAGMSVAIRHGTRGILQFTEGKQDEGKDFGVTTRSMLYSITKTFVSAQILKMVEAGDFALTDTVDTVLATHPDIAIVRNKTNQSATVAQLLNHTSGNTEYTDNTQGIMTLTQAVITGGLSQWSPAKLIELVNTAPVAPGTYDYCNTNYVLLGMIAEHKSGKSLQDLLASSALSNTNVKVQLAPQQEYTTSEAQPYDDLAVTGGTAGTFGNITKNGTLHSQFFLKGMGISTWAVGGMHTTAQDVANWGYELYSNKGKVLSSTQRNALLKSADDDTVNHYGYGVTRVDVELNGQTKHFYGHGGGGNGFLTILYYNPDLDVSIAILTNSNNSDNNGNIQTFDGNDLYQLCKTLLNQMPTS